MRSPSFRAILVVICLTTAGAALPSPASAATLSQTKQSLASLARSAPGSTSIYVREQATNTVLASRTPSTARIPASVTKLFTTSSALLLDGPTTQLTTELRMTGTLSEDGVLDGDLIVRGVGDPSLRIDQLATLAAGARKTGIKRISGSLRADRAGWTAQQGTPKTSGRYDREVGGRIGSLVTLRGFASGTVTDPSKQVLVRVRTALAAAGVGAPGGSMTIGSPISSSAGAVIGRTNSPTIAQLIASTNGPSDNFYAEMLLRGLGARHGTSGTTPAGVTAERTALAELGVSATLADGSGLSRKNRARPTTIVKLLDAMAGRREGAALRNSLPLAGATGTLAGRMRGTAAAGRCRAKTGTLSNVAALAGYCTTVGKRTVTFAILMNKVSVPAGRRAQDRIAATIANWSDPVVTKLKPEPDPPESSPKTTAPAPTSPSSTAPTAGGGVASD